MTMRRIPEGVHVARDSESGAILYWIGPDEVGNLCSDLSSGGRVDDAVAYWQTRVQWVADDATMRRHLKGYGAWDDLAIADSETLQARTLFVTDFDELQGGVTS